MNVILRPTLFSMSCLLMSCSSDSSTFLSYAQQQDKARGVYRYDQAPRRTDALAVNYANSIEELFRARARGTRFTREGSDTALVGLAAFSGAAEPLSLSATALSNLGLASTGILQIRSIFDSRGRSNAYLDAAERIHMAIKDYGAHNLEPISEEFITPNGWTLVNVVQSNIDIVSKILNGRLPSAEALQQASEPMSNEGAVPQSVGSTPKNNIQRNGLVPQITDGSDPALSGFESVYKQPPYRPQRQVAPDTEGKQRTRAIEEKKITALRIEVNELQSDAYSVFGSKDKFYSESLKILGVEHANASLEDLLNYMDSLDAEQLVKLKKYYELIILDSQPVREARIKIKELIDSIPIEIKGHPDFYAKTLKDAGASSKNIRTFAEFESYVAKSKKLELLNKIIDQLKKNLPSSQ